MPHVGPPGDCLAHLRLLRVQRPMRPGLPRRGAPARHEPCHGRLHARLWRRGERSHGHARRRGAGRGRPGDRHHPALHDRGRMATPGRDQARRGRGHARTQAPHADRIGCRDRVARRLRHARGTVRGAVTEAPRPVSQSDHPARHGRLLPADRCIPSQPDRTAFHEPRTPRHVVAGRRAGSRPRTHRVDPTVARECAGFRGVAVIADVRRGPCAAVESGRAADPPN